MMEMTVPLWWVVLTGIALFVAILVCWPRSSE